MCGMNELILRRATVDDVKEIMEIAAEVFERLAIDSLIEEKFGLLNGTTWQQRKADQVREEVLSDPEAVIVAEKDGRVIGFITTTYNEKARVGRISNLAVAAAHQGHGIGKRLLQAAYELLRSKGAKYLQIETLETNEIGQYLYPKLGFQEVGRKIYYFMEVEQWRPPV